jgi:3-oxoadipate enol-lactonase
MNEVTVDGCRLCYVERGEGPETVVLSHSYLVDHRHFDQQIEALAASYRVIAYDHRGHGLSDKPTTGYSMERIYADGVGLVEALDCGPVHWAGLSTGGFVGMRMAVRRPDLLKSLVLMDTAAGAEPRFNQLKYRALFVVLRFFGLRPVMGAAMRGLFGRRFLTDPAHKDEREMWEARIRENDISAIISFGKSIFARDDVTREIAAITMPTLVLVGSDDESTPPPAARKLAAAIPNSQLEIIEGAGHLSTVDGAEAVTASLLSFLAQVRGDAARGWGSSSATQETA